jgi:cobalamin biosynthesis Co2+ chelatase CbiK
MEGEKVKDTDRAFPVFGAMTKNDREYWLDCLDSGMTLKQYAAIKLKVPRSGDPELDAMIRESRRADFAQAALIGLFVVDGYIDGVVAQSVAGQAFKMADVMLAEWEKEENNV